MYDFENSVLFCIIRTKWILGTYLKPQFDICSVFHLDCGSVWIGRIAYLVDFVACHNVLRESKIIFSEKSLSVPMSVCLSVRLSRPVPSCPVTKKRHRNRKYHWTKLSDVFQGWQKYIQNHTDATAVLGKAKLTGIKQPASCHSSKFHHFIMVIDSDVDSDSHP